MSVEEDVYGPSVLISPHTSKPIEEEIKKHEPPTFWCDLCQRKFRACSNALQHLLSKPHRKRVERAANKITLSEQENGLKRKTDSEEPETDQPPTKKTKEPKTPDPDFKCVDCSVEFGSAETTIQHLKGKKHLKKVTSVTTPADEIQGIIDEKVEELSKKIKVKPGVCLEAVMNY